MPNSVKKNMLHKRRPRVVLDSVVLVSVFLTEGGLAAELFTECVEKADLCTAEEILQETRGSISFLCILCASAVGNLTVSKKR